MLRRRRLQDALQQQQQQHDRVNCPRGSGLKQSLSLGQGVLAVFGLLSPAIRWQPLSRRQHHAHDGRALYSLQTRWTSQTPLRGPMAHASSGQAVQVCWEENA